MLVRRSRLLSLAGGILAPVVVACSGLIAEEGGEVDRDAGSEEGPSVEPDASLVEDAGNVTPRLDAGAEPDASAPAVDAGKEPEEPPAPSRPEGQVPNEPYPSTMVDLPRDRWMDGLISPTLESEHHNQPGVVNGYLLLSGNARFSIYDVADPTAPVQLAVRVSPDDCPSCGPAGEAEGHQVGFARYDSTFYIATISGKGIDIWDISNVRDPKHVQAVALEGINYGDFTNAVWGISWQGHTIYVGGTNTGIHVLDARDPADVQVVGRVATADLGGVSAGPLFAIGNILVVTTPKESGGIATLDISDPHRPFVLDAIKPPKSYIGSFYRHHVYLQNPLRVWDVLTDPTTIGPADAPLHKFETPNSEYMSFSDDTLFLGLVRPNPGALKIDVRNLAEMKDQNRVWGRMNLSGADDQFTVAIGNLLVLSDDQLIGSHYSGTVIAVHSPDPDVTAPRVDTVLPKGGAERQPVATRIGLSFTDNIELATADRYSVIVRPVGSTTPLAGTFSGAMTVLNFEPSEPLLPDTEYEIVIPPGRLTDYVGNGVTETFRSTFRTR